MKILISYRGIPQSPGWATGDLVVDAFKQLGHEVYIYGNLYKCGVSSKIPGSISIDEVKNMNFDLALYMEMNDDDSQYVELKYINARVRAYWDFDVSYHPDFTNAICHYMDFDHIFCANPDYQDFFDGIALRVSVLPYAFCNKKHTLSRRNFHDRKYQFAIIGSPWKKREEIVKALCNEGLDAYLIADVFREEYVDTLNNTKVSINYNVSSGRGLLVMRVWESLSTGCCLLTNSDDHISRFLSVGNDCLVYKDIPGLVETCKRIDTEPWIALHVAMNGHATGMAHHTYMKRAKSILKDCNLERENG